MIDPAIHTKFTKLLGVTTPIVSPSMAGASGGSLAAEVSLAGGFGFIGVGHEKAPIEKLVHELTLARNILKTPPTEPLPVGVGFIGWILDKSESLSKDLFPLLFEHRVKAIWLSFGDKLGHYVQYIRELSQQTGHNILVFILVSSLGEAQRAINEWKADVIVAQGIEAGGHGASYGLPLFTLLPLILAHTSPDGPPILGAGGLATGSQIAALLTLGASGAVLGTRFLTASESLYTDAQRTVLLASTSDQSVRTMAFDEARGTLGWPQGIDGRGIRNATLDDYEKGVDVSVIRDKYTEASAKGDTDRIVVWAGTGVGLIKHKLPAKDIVTELHKECLGRLTDARNLIIQ